MLGLDEAVSVNVGAAPTPREVLVFFHAIGIPLAELWGMSETCGAGSCNPPDRIKIGTVGPAGPGIELKLAEDGELLMRSGVVMTGYRNAPDKTAEALDADGWLHTGDIAEIDEDGYVRIVDRKKEIIINAAGKNMSPANIESTLKGATPADRAGVRDRRRAALQHRADRARLRLRAGVGRASRASRAISPTLARDERVRAAVQAGRRRRPTRSSRASSRSRSSTLVEGDWLPGGDEITPTMKLKRKPIAAKYAERDRGAVLELRYSSLPPGDPPAPRAVVVARLLLLLLLLHGRRRGRLLLGGGVSPTRRRAPRPEPRARPWRARRRAWFVSYRDPVYCAVGPG